MPDTQDDEFGKELAAAFAEDEQIRENTPTPAIDEANNPTETAAPEAPANTEEQEKDDPANPTDPNKKETQEPETPPADPAKPAEEDPAETQAPETPPETNAPTPLTEEGVLKLLQQARTQEVDSTKELNNTYNEVMESYYPGGLSNVLVDQSTGKELRTPQDVVDAARAAGDEMSTEQAAQWLLNEQYKLDQKINEVKGQAAKVAETTVNFKRDSQLVLEKYSPLFKAYPQVQQKIYDLMIKQVKVDAEKGVVLSAPDVVELYDTYLEPYQQAYEFSTQQSATNPTPQATPAPTPGINDRLDEGGDGGANTEVDDPNDFAQQLTKELAKGNQ